MTYTNEEFQKANEETKLAIMIEIAERIAYKYTRSNSFNISQDDMTQELSLVAWQMMQDSNYSEYLGYYIKGMYNKAVDIYHEYKKIRGSEFCTDFDPDAYFDFTSKGKGQKVKSRRGLDDDEFQELDKKARNSGNVTFDMFTSNLGSTRTMDLCLLVSEILELPIDDLEKKYILIKLKMNCILDDIPSGSLDLSLIEDVDFSDIEGEYDAVLALDHYTTPKSGSWYARKYELLNLIKQYLG